MHFAAAIFFLFTCLTAASTVLGFVLIYAFSFLTLAAAFPTQGTSLAFLSATLLFAFLFAQELTAEVILAVAFFTNLLEIHETAEMRHQFILVGI